MTRLVFSLIGLALVAVVAIANALRAPDAVRLDWQVAPRPPREVQVERLQRGLIIQTVPAPGVVEAVDEAKIASQIVGRVAEVAVKDGQSVKTGDLLVRLVETEALARLESARARVERLRQSGEQAAADLEKARRDLDRATRLSDRGASSVTELADARTAQKKAESAVAMNARELDESRAILRTSEEDFSRTRILAPIDGVVAGLEVEVGEVVIAGTTNLPGTVLMTVADLSRLQVRADVDEADVPSVRPGQPARVYLQSNLARPFPGTVENVAPKGKKTDETVSFETLIRIRPADGVLPGMTATVEIETQRASDALSVPVQAVVHRRRKDLPDTPALRAWSERRPRSPAESEIDPAARYVPLVFVLEDGVARARPVETGLSDERRIEILSGLESDAEIIVGPFRTLDELRDGDPVTLLKPDANPTP